MWVDFVVGSLIGTPVFPSPQKPTFKNFNSIDLRRRLDLLILLIKRYIHSCKINEKNLKNLQFINKIKMQWKIENLT